MLLILLKIIERKCQQSIIKMPKIIEEKKEDNDLEKEKSEKFFNKEETSKILLGNNKEQKALDLNLPILKENDEKSYEEKNLNSSGIYIISDIKNILIDFPKETIEKIQEQYISKKDKESIYLFEIKQKRKKREKFGLKVNIKLGRKKNDDNIEGEHNKNTSDNIIKKCKRIFFSNIIDYINEYVNLYKINDNEQFELLKLDYDKYVSNLKKENEIKLFNTQLKDIASLEISDKYKSNKNKDINKIKIKSILEKEKNNKIINNLLNLTFGEWIDIFSLKNKIDNNIEFYGLQNSLKKIAELDNDEYFSRFIFYLFNYKRWFYNKKGRKRNRK